MPLDIDTAPGITGLTLTVRAERESDAYRWNHTDGAWQETPAPATDENIPLVEGTGYYAGSYSASVSGMGDAGWVTLTLSDGTTVRGAVRVYVLGGVELPNTASQVLATVAVNGITIAPLSSTVSSGKVISDDVTVYQHARYQLQFGITDEENVPKNVTGKTLVLYVFDPTDLSIKWQLAGSNIVISGDDGNQVAVSGSETTTALARNWAYVLRNLTDKEVLARGAFTIEPLPVATAP